MAGIALSGAGKILSIGQAIKDAVATDRRNKKEYRGILTCVDRVYSILWCLRENTHLTQHPVMNDTLDDLANSLEEALDLIYDCQGRNAITRLLKAGDTAKELRRVKNDIDQKLLVGMFAGMMQIFTLTATIQDPQGRRNIAQISVITISVDLGCEKCYMKFQKILCKLQERENMKEIEFDEHNNLVSVSGLFNPARLMHILCTEGGRIFKEITIVADPAGGTNSEPWIVEEPNVGTDPPRSTRSLGLPTVPDRPFSLQIQQDAHREHCTRPSAAESRVQKTPGCSQVATCPRGTITEVVPKRHPWSWYRRRWRSPRSRRRRSNSTLMIEAPRDDVGMK